MHVVKATDRDLREYVIEQVLDFIRSSELSPGLRLPPENELATAFGVSRTVVREAMKSLQATGAISVEQGRGTFVAEFPLVQSFKVLSHMNQHRMMDLFDVRRVLEGESAFYAAAARTPAQLADIAESLDDAARHISEEDWTGALEDDIAFHRAVTRATGLTLLQEMLEVAVPFWVKMNSNFAEEKDRKSRLETGNAEHTAVYEAIKAGDGAAARGAMHRHIRASQQRRLIYEQRRSGD
jgi:GntR family transcriptional repressor for pyruvate dehydrogenase complex